MERILERHARAGKKALRKLAKQKGVGMIKEKKKMGVILLTNEEVKSNA